MQLLYPKDQQTQQKQVLIVTGLSGAGKNVVMRALEDLSFYCVDNLPVPLISTFLKFAFHSHSNLLKVAIGIDARGERFLDTFMRELDEIHLLSGAGSFIKIIFLQAHHTTLVKRFEETRRKHPLAKGRSLKAALRREHILLEPIVNRADVVLDTDTFNIHELRSWVHRSFSEKGKTEIVLNIISFGFKYGVPLESNLVFDVRFLPNPYFVPDLKLLDGRSADVQQFLGKEPLFTDYWGRFLPFVHYLVQNYFQEGRPFVTLAIGCTGGKHRSVTLVEKLKKERWKNIRCTIFHRDITKS
jgi:UPF0042 nucleotide-binding protein